MREDLWSRQYALCGLVSLPLEKSKVCWRGRELCALLGAAQEGSSPSTALVWAAEKIEAERLH